ncbi:hypothetical protein ACHAXT_003596 [Thalassiosira profunda]
MGHDNFSALFASAAAPAPPASVSGGPSEAAREISYASEVEVENGAVMGEHGATATAPSPGDMNGSSTSAQHSEEISGEETGNESDLLGGHPATHQPPQPSTQTTKPGTESFQYLKKFGSKALKPLREMQLAERLNAMNVEMEERQNQMEADMLERLYRRQLEEQDRERMKQAKQEEEMADQSETLARELQAKEEEDECERIKMEADVACQRVGRRYDALVKFTKSCPHGTYEEFVEFLLMGGSRRESDDGDGDYDSLLFEPFYDKTSEYRKLWNDNLTLGLPGDATTLEGRAFVPAVASYANAGQADESADPWHLLSHEEGRQRSRTFSEGSQGRTLRDRAASEGERIKKQIAQVDKETIKQGLGSAVNALSTVSSFALKPLRDLQLAEKLNAMNIDAEEAEAQKEIEQYHIMQEEKRDLEEMMRIKREAEEICLNATKDHLLDFIRDNPDASYQTWIEELHPENAHDGTLLEGMGKTIDHRFFVEESDHRRLWNENLHTFVDAEAEGRSFVPARAKQMDERGESVVAEDILSGSLANVEPAVGKTLSETGLPEETMNKSTNSDLIAFD